LNKIAEACPARRVRLKYIAAAPTDADARAVCLVLALRHDKSHGEDARFEETRQLVAEFRRLGAQQQRKVVTDVAERVSRECKFPSASALVQSLLVA